MSDLSTTITPEGSVRITGIDGHTLVMTNGVMKCECGYEPTGWEPGFSVGWLHEVVRDHCLEVA
jgi:hypothetical protein